MTSPLDSFLSVVTAVDRWWLRPRVASALLVVLGAVVLVPYLFTGPGHFLDDWFALRNARTDVWWNAAGPDQWRSRPGAGVVYALTFGLVGAQPWLYVLTAGAIIILTALVLDRVLRRFVPPAVSLAVAAAWLIIPNHTSLETWPSALNIAVALLLLVVAIERLTSLRPSLRMDLQSTMFLGLSVLTYEATAPAGFIAVVAVAMGSRADKARRQRLLVLHGITLGSIASWMFVNQHEAKVGIDVWIDPVQVVNGHVSTGVVGEHVGAVILTAVVLTISVVATYLHLKAGDRHDPLWPVSLVLGGWMLIVLGALPFTRYYYSPVGFGDRVTVVSGIGGAAVLVGVIGWIGRRNAVVAGMVAMGVLAAAVGNRISLIQDYGVAADDSRRILDEVQRRWPEPPDETIVFGPYPVVKRNIVAFIDADWPVQWLYGTRTVSAGFTLTEEAFESIPSSRRVDVVSLSELEALDRIER